MITLVIGLVNQLLNTGQHGDLLGYCRYVKSYSVNDFFIHNVRCKFLSMLVIDRIIQEHNSQHNVILQTNELQSGKSTVTIWSSD